MALRVAVANGNWSNPATWNGGVKPTVGDVVASNNYTVTIDENINVDSITNAAQGIVGMVPNMTGYTTPSGIVEESSSLVGFEGWKAFGNGEWRFNLNGWVSYEFTSPKAINQYYFQGDSGKSNWNFEAWNGSNWIVLHSVTGASTTVYTSPLIGNSTPYSKYRVFFFQTTNGNRVDTIQFYEYLGTSPAIAGGTFILNDGVTVTCTNTGDGILIGATTLLTYSGTGSVVINANFGGITANSINGFLISGASNVTINGTINGSTSNSSTTTINVTAAATLNVNGNVNGFSGSAGNANAIRMNTSGGILNLVGNIELRGTQKQTVSMLAGTTLNMTGNILCQFSSANSGEGVSATAATINITGNLSITNATNVNNVNWYCLGTTACTINIIGTISNDLTINAMAFSYPVVIGGASYFNHVGSVIGGLRAPALVSTNVGAINILTGPFISSPNGIQPFNVARMHYRRTIGSYYEFRDNSTNGALPPGASAPATRLVSPDTVADSPIPANVRQGTVYSLGSQTGTMIVPSPSNVANNVPVDNTVGTAVLDPNAIWAVPLTSINTLNSIGRRVKNAATVETTGAQIQTTLNNNE